MRGVSGCSSGVDFTGPLYRDGWFWGALAIGPLTSWLLFVAVGGERVAGLGGAWQQLLWLTLFYPLMEEVTFRAALQGWLLQTRWGGLRKGCITAANAVTSMA